MATKCHNSPLPITVKKTWQVFHEYPILRSFPRLRAIQEVIATSHFRRSHNKKLDFWQVIFLMATNVITHLPSRSNRLGKSFTGIQS